MKKKIIILAGLLFYAHHLPAPTNLYFKNRTPFTLSLTTSHYRAGEGTTPASYLVKGKYYDLVKTTLKPGENTKIFWINRDIGIKCGINYRVNINATVPDPSGSDSIFVRPYISVTGDKGVLGICPGSSLQEAVSTSFSSGPWKSSTDWYSQYLTRTQAGKISNAPEGFLVRIREVPAVNHLKTSDQYNDLECELIWYTNGWKLAYPDTGASGNNLVEFFDDAKRFTTGLVTIVSDFKGLNSKLKTTVANIKAKYLPQMESASSKVSTKITMFANIINEIVDDIDFVSLAISRVGNNLVQPFDKTANEKSQEVSKAILDINDLIKRAKDDLIPKIVDIVKAIEAFSD